TLGVARFDWERTVVPDASLVSHVGDLVVVADASLYDTSSLARELIAAGHPPAGTTNEALIASAYRVWGPAFALRLNGDFAFLLWDAAQGALYIGRDFIGRRALFTRKTSEGVGVASQAGALAAMGSPPRLNRDFIAAAVSGLLSGSRESAYEGITPVPAGAV